MTMTNLNMTKEEIIYNFIIAINKGPAGGDLSSEIVCKAINEYNKLIEEGIIKEIEPNGPQVETYELKGQMVMDTAGDLNARMYDVATHPIDKIKGFRTGELYGEADNICPNTLTAKEGQSAFDDFGIEKVDLINKAGDVVKTMNMWHPGEVIKSNTFPTEEVKL